ncbi:MAG: AAA family ATPase [Telmatospirillum sp.]|nr:AAA family ATPase [Telmatospirillum sp.]
MSVLLEIQEDVLNYAKAIAGVIGTDVEIADHELMRVAATGVLSRGIGQGMAEAGYVYKEVLKSGRTTIIENPGLHALCRRCPKYGACEEKMELCTPISLDGRIIGVIGIICTTDEQHRHLASRLDAYCLFLEQVAGFISGKAFEYQEGRRRESMIRMLDQVVETMGRGVIILGRDEVVVHANRLAKQMLDQGDGLIGQKVRVRSTGDFIENLEEVRLTVRGQTTQLMSQAIPVSPGLADYDRIMVFSDIPTLSQSLYHIEAPDRTTVDNILGPSAAMGALREAIGKVAPGRSSVLVTGESGTGKELVARAIHAASPRAREPFVAINCAAIPDTLLESELFGHVKGAFTGADPKGRIGKFELANNGTLFLDEIGDMPLHLQAKLLRVLEDLRISRIGSNQVIPVDVRIISATTRDLAAMVRDGRFREDLYYRLHVVPVPIPPLRSRPEDIPEIARALIGQHAARMGRSVRAVDRALMDRVRAHDWPGNVRELGNVVEYMLTMMGADDVLTLACLPPGLATPPGHAAPPGHATPPGHAAPAPVAPAGVASGGGLRALERESERQAVAAALGRHGWTLEGKRRAAAELGVSIATLYRKIGALGLSGGAAGVR